MKILFICTSIDSYLQKQVKALQFAKHQVDILNILEYKMIFDNGKKIHIRPKTKFKILEHFFISDEINEYFRRREVFNYLDRYDIVSIYKCSQYAVDVKDKIELISFKYTITINEIIPQKTSKIEDLFKNAKVFFFQNEREKQSFNYIYGYAVKSLVLYEPVELLHIYDSIDYKIYKEFLQYTSLSEDKKNVFVHFHGARHKQKELMVSLANLPIEVKHSFTFLLYFDNEDTAINNELIFLLKEIKLDYIIIKKDATQEQIAMLLKVSNASIFINHSPLNNILIASLYAKNHPFLYKPKDLDPFFQHEKIFLDNFSEFYFYFEKDEINEGLFEEIYKRNKKKISEIFSLKSFESRYINATLR